VAFLFVHALNLYSQINLMTKTILTSAAAITGIEAVNQVPTSSNTVEIGKLIIQIIIGIATLIKMWKKKKEA
jgi:hypothetical protein